MDWVGIIRELRLLALQLPSDRFYAVYGLLVVLAIVFTARWLWRHKR